MKKIVSAVLCAATLLTLGGCKKDPVSNPTVATHPSSLTPSIEDEQKIPTSIVTAIQKTTEQTSFRMSLSIRAGSDEKLVTLKVNDYGSEKLSACGTISKGEKIDSFSVNQKEYLLLDSDSTLTTGHLTETYDPCTALFYCDKLFSLLSSNVPAQSKIDIQSTSEVTIHMPTASFSNIWEIFDCSSASIRISTSPDGYCSEVCLTIKRSDSTEEYRFKFEDFAVAQEITAIHEATITEAKWKQAFTASAFENVTITRYYDDRSKDNPHTTMIASSISAKTLRKELLNPDNTLTQLDGMSYYYQFGSQFYEMEYGTSTAQDGTKTSHYKLEPTDKYKGETAGSFAAHLNDTFGLTEQFSRFIYDETSQSYQSESSGDTWNYQYSLRFNHGRLISIVQTLSDKNSGEIHTVYSYYFNNYGTTVIEIPTAS